MKKKPTPAKKKEAAPVAAAAKKKSAAAAVAAAAKKTVAVSASAKKKPTAAAAPAAKKRASGGIAASAKKKPAASAKKRPAAEKKEATAAVCVTGRKKPAAVPAAAKKKPPARVSATGKKKPAPAPASAAAKKTTAAAVPTAAKKKPPATKKRASGGTAGCRPQKRARVDIGDADLISHLPDAMLGTIISLLPTKDGARTQAIARRWRPLWRVAPLNIDAEDLSAANSKYTPRRRGPRPPTTSVISRILSDHPGPVRRFDFRLTCIYPRNRGYAKDAAQIESWLRSPSLDNLQELHIFFPISILADQTWKPYRLPSSVLRFAASVVVATIGYCEFPNEIAAALNFPVLKHLTLRRVSISEDLFRGALSACHVLETLFLQENAYTASLQISSPTLQSIVLRDCYMGGNDLVIDDAPHLERLLCIGLDGRTIRVNKAPKLEILGPLSPRFYNVQIGNLVFQKLIQTSLNNSISTVKSLALEFSCSDLDAVLDILRFFPCLEKLYVMWNKNLKAKMKNVRQYDPLDPIKCLQIHLKKLVLKNYKGDEQDVSFAKFFVLNAEVLNEIIFGVNEKIDKKWVANQHGLLGVETKASPDAQFKFIRGSPRLGVKMDTHDLSIADPFNCLFADGVDALSEEAGSYDRFPWRRLG